MKIPDRALVRSGENNVKECQRHPRRGVEFLLRSTTPVCICPPLHSKSFRKFCIIMVVLPLDVTEVAITTMS